MVGGGPAGSLAAIMLGKEHDVVVAEEHQTPGFPVQCAGLISKDCFTAYSRYCKIKRAVDNRIKGAFFFSPDGNFVEARGEAYVVERKMLDSMLFNRASDFAETLVKLRVRFEGRSAYAGNRRVDADRIIGADGVNSVTAKYFGFERPELFLAVQIEARFDPIDENYVELYFGNDYSRGFFAYAVPLGDTARIGVVSKTDPLACLRRVIEKHPSTSKRIKGGVIELNVGAVPIGLVDFVKENVALIGDSAGMVKPYTGGGLYYLLVAAEKLAESFPNLEDYRKAYLKELEKEYKFGQKLLSLYSKLSDEDYNQLTRALRDFTLSGISMDRPSTLLNATKAAIRLAKIPKTGLRILSTLLF